MTDIGMKMLEESYFYKGEKTPRELFERVCGAVADSEDHKERLISYMLDEKFFFATPTLANSGTDRGLPISCYVNEVGDSRKDIFGIYEENFWLGSDGGGVGTDWSLVREIGSPIKDRGKSSGIIPFIKISDSTTLGVSQGGLRRASQAVYLDISHPEILEFIDIRKDDGSDLNRRSTNIHHSVKITDSFMEKVLVDGAWDLISPKDDRVIKTVNAFDLFCKILTTRIERGEPYIFFSDNVNRHLPELYKLKGWSVQLSNLCTEILQHTATDKTAVCALGSINLVKWDQIENDQLFFDDIVRAVDNVLTNFAEIVKDQPAYSKALKSVLTERNIGIGQMGWHTLLQGSLTPFESAMADGLNRKIFSTIEKRTLEASEKLGVEKGCPEGLTRRNNLIRAIAPTSSISMLCGEVSPGIDPIIANAYTHKLNVGTFIVKNPMLDAYLKSKGKESEWKSIVKYSGSVQHLEWMDQNIKDVFKTAYELDQRWIIEHAANRTPYIDQGSSTNLFLPSDVSKQELFDLHVMAWKKGLKTLYYMRSTAPERVGLSKDVTREVIKQYDECLSCQ